MESAAFCPAYATGLFTIGEGDAAGAGFAIDSGMTTTISKVERGRTIITINKSEAAAPVSKVVLRKYAEICGKVGLINIRHETPLPIGYGLGMSAAGALSLSLALNEFLGAGLSREKCVKIAHDSDVECGTGLSGVDAAAIGGILARKSVGGKPVKLKFEKREMEIAFFSPMRTSDFIKNDEWKRRINENGNAALKRLFEDKNWDAFVEASRMFSVGTGLASWCGSELSENRRASMAMIGKTLFSDEPLRLSRPPMKTINARLQKEGAELI